MHKVPNSEINQDIKKIAIDQMGDWNQIATEIATKNEFLQEIPFIKTAVAIINTYKSVSNYLFARKFLRILATLESAYSHDRDLLTRELSEDHIERTNVGKRIIELCEKIDSEEKAEYIGLAFIALMNKEIDKATFERITNAIVSCSYFDFLELPNFVNADENERITNASGKSAMYSATGLAFTHSGYGIGGIYPSETAVNIVKYIFRIECGP